MSTQELEQKVRELREMQAIVEEAQAEVEALKDAIKAAMGQREELRAGRSASAVKPRFARSSLGMAGAAVWASAVFSMVDSATTQPLFRSFERVERASPRLVPPGHGPRHRGRKSFPAASPPTPRHAGRSGLSPGGCRTSTREKTARAVVLPTASPGLGDSPVVTAKPSSRSPLLFTPIRGIISNKGYSFKSSFRWLGDWRGGLFILSSS